MRTALIVGTYLLASALFILGLKGLTHPRTAVRGNLLGALGMFLAVLVTLVDRRIIDWTVILAGLVVGSALGAILATKIQMTAMPQLVALFNGLGGAASALVAGAALMGSGLPEKSLVLQYAAASAAAGLIGAVTFWGSLVAFGKLQVLIPERAMSFTGQQVFNAVLAVLALGLGASLIVSPESSGTWYWALVGVASVLGVSLVMPIGGADMPVVIALLNSYSGLAAAATGFVLMNNVLIIAGALVGASGLILTRIMCQAMNRSLTAVLFGVAGPPAGKQMTADQVYGGKVKSATPDEVALLFDGARRVVIVPGYGMAVAQAQHAVAELAEWLESHGIEVEYAIHPVAGRMPGHMNVLLAEADVPYEKLKDLDTINPTFEQTDVVLVNGSNDIVNPLARTDASSLIAGMPILDVDKARTVVVVKRSLAPGFAGIPNPLFAADNTLMMFGDGKKMVLELIAALKSA
ncbi:MAG: NAD(P)(+) transhydrogenase (Re/Si-specific) subunit beta [Nitrospiraceae bacterium]